MNARIGWALAAAALVAGWIGWGWRGLVLGLTVITFGLLLQFSRTLRVMRAAGQRPIGHVTSAVMLHAKLKCGMPMLNVVALTGSLGLKTADAPETWRWADGGGDAVDVVIDGHGRVSGHTLRRGAVDGSPGGGGNSADTGRSGGGEGAGPDGGDASAA